MVSNWSYLFIMYDVISSKLCLILRKFSKLIILIYSIRSLSSYYEKATVTSAQPRICNEEGIMWGSWDEVPVLGDYDVSMNITYF